MTASHSHLIVEADQLESRYGFTKVLKGISFKIEKGNCMALVGRNGAGKSTTLRVLLGLKRASQGTVRVFGERPGKLATLKQIAYVPEDGAPPRFLTALEYLYWIASLRLNAHDDQEAEVYKWGERFQLPLEKRIGKLSKGNLRRLLLAAAFIGSPAFMILDEPINGLDPEHILHFRKALEEYLAEGGTALYCSHLLLEAEKVCTHVCAIDAGESRHFYSLPEIQKQHGSLEAAFSEWMKTT